jgi:hypothetical protein
MNFVLIAGLGESLSHAETCSAPAVRPRLLAPALCSPTSHRSRAQSWPFRGAMSTIPLGNFLSQRIRRCGVRFWSCWIPSGRRPLHPRLTRSLLPVPHSLLFNQRCRRRALRCRSILLLPNLCRPGVSCHAFLWFRHPPGLPVSSGVTTTNRPDTTPIYLLSSRPSKLPTSSGL